jgi:hypothetical protein
MAPPGSAPSGGRGLPAFVLEALPFAVSYAAVGFLRDLNPMRLVAAAHRRA